MQRLRDSPFALGHPSNGMFSEGSSTHGGYIETALQHLGHDVCSTHARCDAAVGLRRRAEIELCSRLLSVSAHGLHDNPGLVFFVIVAQVCPSIRLLVV